MMMMMKRTTTATLLYLVVISVVSAVNQVQAEESYAQKYDAMPRQTRSLLQKDEDANIACDEKCQQWARFLSALMVSVFMIGAVVSAMCCLTGLRTPRQFETAKDE